MPKNFLLGHPFPSALAGSDKLFLEIFLAVPVGSRLEATSVCYLGYMEGKKGTQQNHGCVVS